MPDFQNDPYWSKFWQIANALGTDVYYEEARSRDDIRTMQTTETYWAPVGGGWYADAGGIGKKASFTPAEIDMMEGNTHYEYRGTYVPPTKSVAAAAPQPKPVTPTFDPKLQANTLYGKPMPLSSLGFARIGASPAPIVGPYLNDTIVDFVVSFGVPADPSGDRKIYAIYLDNETAWTSVTGGTLPGDGTFAAEPFDFVFKPGTMTQTACSLETAKFPGDEIAYRPQMIIEIRNLPFARFMTKTGKPVPYVACDIGDTTDGAIPQDGINVGEAYQKVAFSPWCSYTSDTFETTGITDLTYGILIKDNFSIIQLGQNLSNTKPNINMLQSDKLRLYDGGANVTPAMSVDRDVIVADSEPIRIFRTESSAQPRELELMTIDPQQDYTIVPSLSQRPRNPVIISRTVGKDTISLPLVLDSETRQATVMFAHYYKENARKKVELKTTMRGYEAEPGDLVALRDIADGINDEIYKIVETSHNGDWTVSMIMEAILRCGATYNPAAEFLAHYEDASSSPTYTFASSTIGAATADRLIVVTVRTMRTQSVPRTITGVTLGGVAMTQCIHLAAGDGSPSANGAITQGIYSALVKTGTAASIVVSLDLTAGGCSIEIFRLTGFASITPYDSFGASSFGGNPSGTINIPFNGTLIASYGGITNHGSVTWTGVDTVHVNEDIGVGNLWWGSAASQNSMVSETGRAVSLSTPATGWENLVAVSFG